MGRVNQLCPSPAKCRPTAVMAGPVPLYKLSDLVTSLPTAERLLSTLVLVLATSLHSV